MNLEVFNVQGEKTGRVLALPDEIFGITPNEHVVYLAVKQYLAAQRQGTHKAKNRNEVHGSSRKLHKQKGTGGSRKGNIRNPLYKGGGTIFGPTPCDYDFKLNKKVKDLARLSVLSDKAKKEAIVVVENIKMEAPKTKTFVEILSRLKLSGKKVLYLSIADNNPNEIFVQQSLRNLPKVQHSELSRMNVYDVLHADALLFTEDAARFFEKKAAV